MATATEQWIHRGAVSLIVCAWITLLVGHWALGVILSVGAFSCIAISMVLLVMRVSDSVRQRGVRAQAYSAVHHSLDWVRDGVDQLDQWVLETMNAQQQPSTRSPLSAAPSPSATGMPVWRRPALVAS